MTEPPIDEPEIEPDCSAVVMAEIVQPGGGLVTWGLAATLICVFFVIDVITPLQMHSSSDSQWIFALLVGLCIAQVNLIAVWASLAPGNIVLRISWSLLLTMAMWYGLILGNRPLPQYSRMTRPDAILLIVILLAGVVVLQIPLWIAKKVFRWRLTRRPGDADASLQEDRQFHLQHLLIATVLISVAFIWACRPLTVVTFGADKISVPLRCSSALITTRNCGSVMMPVIVPTAGIAVLPA